MNVMACKRFLAVCGPTYAKRLWCVWELFTLLSFQNEEDVSDAALSRRLAFVSLAPAAGSGGTCSPLADLSRFDVANARCFDPNEEARLRVVIAAMGAERFNSRIRSLAEFVSSADPSEVIAGLRIEIKSLERKVAALEEEKVAHIAHAERLKAENDAQRSAIETQREEIEMQRAMRVPQPHHVRV